jgi:hypothetical protein
MEDETGGLFSFVGGGKCKIFAISLVTCNKGSSSFVAHDML